MLNMKPAPDHYLIGQFSKAAGVKPDTIRFYEKRGLLPKPRRGGSNYRLYDDAALNQLRFIKKAQALGFTLDEIRRILNLREDGQTPCRCVLQMAEATLSETQQKLAQLQEFHDALAKNLTRWRRRAASGGKMVAEFCSLIESADAC